jgi:hypothetical protein
MKPTYYSAAWSDSECLIGVMRSLSTEEESEFQSAIRNHPSGKPAPHTAAPSAEQGSRYSGYAVMTRVWVVDHWTWATWMCFDTSAQATVHARKGIR